MKRFFSLTTLILATVLTANAASENAFGPTGTYLFAQKDSSTLFLDYYAPASGSETTVNGKAKPTVLFMFGGGFVRGSRNDESYLPYYQQLSQAGYPVVAIDYRLGMKNRKFTGMNLETFNNMYDSVSMAVEDLFSATSWLLANGKSFGVDADNMVICGSSAGAVTVLEAAWILDRRNGGKTSGEPMIADLCGKLDLPDGFQYKGVMSFSGAVVFKNGAPCFSDKMCPVMLLHGTSDRIVKYDNFQIFTVGLMGSYKLDRKMTDGKVLHSFYRYEGKGHEIANIMGKTVDKQEEFIRRAVMGTESFSVDATICDPSIRPFRLTDLKDLY